MIPSRQQWESWSLPSKLTALGFFVGVVGLIATVAPTAHSYFFPPKSKPDLYLTFFGEEMPQFGFGDLGQDLAPPPSLFRYPATASEDFASNALIGSPDGWQSTGSLPISISNIGEQSATEVSVRIDMDARIGLFMIGTDRCDRGVSPSNSVVSVRFVGGEGFEVPGMGQADSYCLVTISVPPIPRDYDVEYFITSKETGSQRRSVTLTVDTAGVSDDLIENARGMDAFILRDLPKAEMHFQNALRLNPERDAARFNLGVVHLNQNAWQDAADAFYQLTKTKSGWYQVWGNFGVSLLQLEDFNCAAAAMEMALDINPQSELDQNNLAILRAEQVIEPVNLDDCVP